MVNNQPLWWHNKNSNECMDVFKDVWCVVWVLFGNYSVWQPEAKQSHEDPRGQFLTDLENGRDVFMHKSIVGSVWHHVSSHLAQNE